MSFRGNFIRQKGVQCVEGEPTQITDLCSCGAELCSKHADIHNYKHHKKVQVAITKEKSALFVRALSPTISTTEELLSIIKDNLLTLSLVSTPAEEHKCVHLLKVFECASSASSTAPKTIYYGSDGCCICSLSRNRWLCFSCGLVFCGKQQYGLEGAQHANEHFLLAAHFLFGDLDSIDLVNRVAVAYCALCEEFFRGRTVFAVVTLIFRLLRGCIRCNAMKKPADPKNREKCAHCSDAAKTAQIATKTGGLERLGKTAYMSSVLVSFSYAVYVADPLKVLDLPDLENAPCSDPARFEMELKILMLKLFCAYSCGGSAPVSPRKFAEALEKAHPMYKIGAQRDPVRFFRNLISLIKKRDEEKSAPADRFADGEIGPESAGNRELCASTAASFSLSHMFSVSVRSTILCTACKAKQDKTEHLSIVYLKPEQPVEEFFGIKQLDASCPCGAKTRTARSVLMNTPSVLTVRVRRIRNKVLGDAADVKIETAVSLPHVLREEALEPGAAIGAEEAEARMAEISRAMEAEGVSVPEELVRRMRERAGKRKKHFGDFISHVDRKNMKTVKIAFLKYVLVCAVVRQDATAEERYFSQIWTDSETPPSADRLWTTIEDERVGEAPLFVSDAFLLFYTLI